MPETAIKTFKQTRKTYILFFLSSHEMQIYIRLRNESHSSIEYMDNFISTLKCISCACISNANIKFKKNSKSDV